jgi:hypothetical protein
LIQNSKFKINLVIFYPCTVAFRFAFYAFHFLTLA